MSLMNRFVRRRSDDGAAAVEFALLFPIFAILTFGAISAGIAFSRQINITQAARETSRYGSTLSLSAAGDTTSPDKWFDQVWSGAVDSAGDGYFAGFDSICIVYHVSGSSWFVTSQASPNQDQHTAPAAGDCPNVAASSLPQYVQVSITRSTDFNFVLADPHLTLSSRSVTPYEAVTS